MKKKNTMNIFITILIIFKLLIPETLFICHADNNESAPIINSDFESGTIEGWGCLGSGTPSIDGNHSYSGSYSLLITNRQQNWNGPSLVITENVQPDTAYHFQGYVYHESKDTETFMWTMKWTDSTGEVLYEYINTVQAPPKQWTMIEGILTSPSSEIKEALYYVESPNPALEFNIDSLNMSKADHTQITTPPVDVTQIKDINDVLIKDNLIMTNDFEDGTLENWMPMGEGKLLSSSQKYCSGNFSLLVTEREAEWDGPSLDTTKYIMSNNIYTYSVNIYHEGNSEVTFTMTEKCKNSNGNTSYTTISSEKIKPRSWTTLQGSISSTHDHLSSILYIETDSGNAPFYIDDVKIYGVSSEKPETSVFSDIVQRTTDEHLYDFEKDMNGWTSRGEIRIIRTNEYSNSGSYSLYVSDRIETWNGAIKNIDFITRDISYNYSMYVMYNGKDYTDNHRFLLQLQYELDGTTTYQIISTKDIKKNTWTKIHGDFVVPADARNVSMYIQSDHIENTENLTYDDLLSFYIDDVRIIMSTSLKKQNTIIIIVVIIAIFIFLTIAALLFRNVSIKNKKIRSTLQKASIDSMTNVLNRNAYEEKIEYYKENPDECRDIFITVCDINFLKLINDSYGHEHGDEVIIRCAQLLVKSTGQKGTVYRIGGDEFVCISTANPEKELRKNLNATTEQTIGYPFSVAIGCTRYNKELDGDTPDIDIITKRADSIMYLNKEIIKENYQSRIKKQK